MFNFVGVVRMADVILDLFQRIGKNGTFFLPKGCKTKTSPFLGTNNHMCAQPVGSPNTTVVSETGSQTEYSCDRLDEEF